MVAPSLTSRRISRFSSYRRRAFLPLLRLPHHLDTDARADKAHLFLKNARQQIELLKSPVLLFDAE